VMSLGARCEHAMSTGAARFSHRSDLHARVDGRAHRAPQRVPAHVVIPVEKLRPPVLPQVLGGAEVEPARAGTPQQTGAAE